MLDKAATENPTGFKVIVKEFKKDKLAMGSLIVLAVLWLAIFIGAAVLDQDEIMYVDILSSYARPGENGFLLGADYGGRSILGQLIIGGRNSILIGVSVTILTTIIGIVVGLIAGFYGGKIDNAIMRIIDFIQVLPTMMIIIVIVTIIPKYNMLTFTMIMVVFYWVGNARLVRSKALTEARRDYVSASKTMGTKSWKIMLGGILPNISSIIIVDATLSLAANIGIETGLSFLGFGLPPATPSLGTLIGYARSPEVIADRLYIWLPASLLILVMMLCINYIGQALRRASDAKQRLG
ncbi:ABC transporter permease [Miniphocaeibacter halophilus]|uniref:ABC transporter permease n=2 Tax=Miniphocaeibacter halophilus TaxID=2931922 RepID=A0AC61MTP1_9FIRM|nr:ABC transporter permease [Miniphocaeibacter halophilus]